MNLQNRHSIRLKGYDYSSAGAYFITICTQNRRPLFGNIIDETMILNDAGRMVLKWYTELENKYADIKCNEKMVMPNHFHCIIEITNIHYTNTTMGEHIGSPLPRVLQWFKTMTTNEYISGVKNYSWSPFYKRVWQRNYWEHIIRDINEYDRVSEYIITNPQKWGNDQLNCEQGNFIMEKQASYALEDWMV